MYNIVYLPESLLSIEWYIIAYRDYFLEIYSDTGIWSEKEIKEQYILISDARHEEILTLIEERLPPDAVIGQSAENRVKIPWRSKFLVVSWKEEKNTREITHIDIIHR